MSTRGNPEANLKSAALAAGFDIEKLTHEFYVDPYPTYRALREHEPVKRMGNGSYFLTRYDDLLTAYKNTAAFSSDKKKEFAPKYGGPCSMNITRRVSFSTTRPPIPACEG
jgi:cytochrome P450